MDFPFDIDSDNIELSDFEKMLMRVKVKDMTLSDEERVTPDTFGCDCVFLRYFVTPEMEDDFPLIAKDFLQHEMKNLHLYSELRYVSTDAANSWPVRAYQNLILNLMMGAVHQGSEYARSLFCYLHKTYYKKEYKQLKRFKKISGEEIMAVANDGKNRLGPYSMARILCISRMYGIEIDKDCSFLYLYLNEEKDRLLKEDTREFYSFPEGLVDSCMEEAMDMFDDEWNMLEEVDKADDFVRDVLQYFGYADDFIDLCDEENYGTELGLSKTLSFLKLRYPDKKIDKELLLVYYQVYRCISALQSVCDSMQSNLESTLGVDDGDFYDDFPPLFHPEEILAVGQAPDKKEKKTMPVKEHTEQSKYSEAALLAEIESLRTKLHSQENNNKQLQNQLRESQRTINELGEQHKRMEEDKKELAALREHVYHFTENDMPALEWDLGHMKAAIENRNIIIIGGNENWVKKMRQEFPKWRFISPKVSGTVSGMQITNADRVFIFTDTLGHSTYYKFMQVIREHEVPFSYIHGVNIEANINQIYREMNE